MWCVSVFRYGERYTESERDFWYILGGSSLVRVIPGQRAIPMMDPPYRHDTASHQLVHQELLNYLLVAEADFKDPPGHFFGLTILW